MRGRLLLHVGAEQVRAHAFDRRGKEVWRAVCGYGGLEDLGHAIAGLTAEVPARWRACPVLVELDSLLVQVRTLHGLPPVPASALRAMVDQQATRFFRKPDGCLVVDAVRDGPRLVSSPVVAAAAEEALLVAIVRGAQSADMIVQRISPVGRPSLRRMNLLPNEELGRRHRQRRGRLRLLTLAAAALWIAVGAVSLLRLSREAARLHLELRTLAEPIAAVGRLEQQIDEANAMTGALTRSQDDQLRMELRLATLVRSLPDSAFLTSLTIERSGRGSVTGVARRSTQALASLQAALDLQDARLDGPTSREVVSGQDWERFALTWTGKAGT